MFTNRQLRSRGNEQLRQMEEFKLRPFTFTSEIFTERLEEYMLTYPEIPRNKARAIVFDKTYHDKIDLQTYKGDWICYAYSDAWFQAFGYDAKAHYTTSTERDFENTKALIRQKKLSGMPTTLKSETINALYDDPVNLPPLHRLHFDVDNEQKLFLFGSPVHAHATAETLDKTNRRIKIQFPFTLPAPECGNYLIIGYEENVYAVVGDFDLKYLWFLVREDFKYLNTAIFGLMRDAALKFGYSPEFINRMNYRDHDGRYHKARTYYPMDTTGLPDELVNVATMLDDADARAARLPRGKGKVLIPGPG